MKRARLAALWIATLVAMWFIVRGDREDERVQSEERVATPSRTARSASPRPALVRHGPGKLHDEAFQNALATLERDMADGKWSIADRDRLAAAPISGKQMVELYTVLFPKLNDGSVKSEIDGPPI